MRNNIKRAAFVVTMVVVFVAGVAGLARPLAWRAEAAVPKGPVAGALATAGAMSLPDFSSIIKQFGPAVVNVSTAGMRKTVFDGPSFGQIDPDDPFWKFFPRFGGPQPRSGVPTQGLGSGFIVGVVVGESPQDQVASVDGQAPHGRLGVTVRPITPEEQRPAETKGGVVVEGVTGPAARAGLQPGDVVLSVSGTPVTGVDQLRSLVARAGKQVALLIQRGEARIFVPVALG